MHSVNPPVTSKPAGWVPTVAGKPIVAINGQVALVAVRNPAFTKTDSPIIVQRFGIPGQMVCRVVAVDSELGRVPRVAVGDTVYLRDADIQLRLAADGGETVFVVNECLLGLKVEGVGTEVLTDEDRQIMRSHNQDVAKRQRAQTDAEIMQSVLSAGAPGLPAELVRQ